MDATRARPSRMRRSLGAALLAALGGAAAVTAGCRTDEPDPAQQFPEVSPGDVADTLGFDTIPGEVITPDQTAPGGSARDP